MTKCDFIVINGYQAYSQFFHPVSSTGNMVMSTYSEELEVPVRNRGDEEALMKRACLKLRREPGREL